MVWREACFEMTKKLVQERNSDVDSPVVLWSFRWGVSSVLLPATLPRLRWRNINLKWNSQEQSALVCRSSHHEKENSRLCVEEVGSQTVFLQLE